MTSHKLRSCAAVAALLPALATACAAPAEDASDPLGSDSAIAPEWCRSLPRAQYATLERRQVDSDWFEVYDVGDGVFAIYEPKQWQEVISYLVIGSQAALLFDSGMGISRISDVVAELTTLPVTVLNSHTHMDHVGGNADFERVIAMDTDYTRGRARGLSKESVRNEVEGDALCGALPSGVTADGFETRAFRITETVRDGHRISLGDRDLDIVHIPGHTPDAIALLERATGYLWTGDSFYEGTIWLFAQETDLVAYAQSVERLAALVPDLTRVFPAHNTPVAEPGLLTELRDALLAIEQGRLQGSLRAEAGLIEYELSTFSLRMRPKDGS